MKKVIVVFVWIVFCFTTDWALAQSVVYRRAYDLSYRDKVISLVPSKEFFKPFTYSSNKGLLDPFSNYSRGWFGLINPISGDTLLTKFLGFDNGTTLAFIVNSSDTSQLFIPFSVYTTAQQRTIILKSTPSGTILDTLVFDPGYVYPNYLVLGGKAITKNRILLQGQVRRTLQNSYDQQYARMIDTLGNTIWERTLPLCVSLSFEPYPDGTIVLAGVCSNELRFFKYDTLGNQLSNFLAYQQPNNFILRGCQIKQTPDGGLIAQVSHTTSITNVVRNILIKFDNQFQPTWSQTFDNQFPTLGINQDGSMFGYFQDQRRNMLRLWKWDANGTIFYRDSLLFSTSARAPEINGMYYTGDGDAILYGSQNMGGIQGDDLYFLRLSNVGYEYDPSRPVTSLAKTSQKTILSLYPNPGRGFQVLGLERSQELVIQNLAGQVLHQQELSAGELVSPDVPSGVYLVRVGVQVLRWVKP